MAPNYLAEPPQPAWRGKNGGLLRYSKHMVTSLVVMLKYAVIPFNARPEEPVPLPQPAHQPSAEQVAQCQAIFDEAEARRSRIEQKAQWAFAVVAFLVPFLASLLVFIFRDPSSASRSHIDSLFFLSLSAGLLLLSFFSAARALSIRSMEALHLAAVIDPASGQFRKYNAGFHAQGLLYCSVMNTAMNDHMAQLVRGAHVFAAGGLIFFLCGAMPAGLALANNQVPPTNVTIDGPVELSPSNLEVLSERVGRLVQTIAAEQGEARSSTQLTSLESQVATLNAEVAKLESLATQHTHAQSLKLRNSHHSRTKS